MNLPKKIRQNGFHCYYSAEAESYQVTVEYINPEEVKYALKSRVNKNTERKLLPLYKEAHLLSFKLTEAGDIESISMGDWNKCPLDAVDFCYATNQIWGYYAKLAKLLDYSFFELMQLD